jgi:phage-related protein
MIGKFFHTPKPRGFSIPFRYYDSEKEAMQEREDRIRKELGLEERKDWDPDYRPNIRGQFRRSLKSSKTVKDSKRRSATRLVVLIVILSLIFYFLLKF